MIVRCDIGVVDKLRQIGDSLVVLRHIHQVVQTDEAEVDCESGGQSCHVNVDIQIRSLQAVIGSKSHCQRRENSGARVGTSVALAVRETSGIVVEVNLSSQQMPDERI